MAGSVIYRNDGVLEIEKERSALVRLSAVRGGTGRARERKGTEIATKATAGDEQGLGMLATLDGSRELFYRDGCG